jgi:gag-polypeptide of LTR copia-type
MKEGQTIESWIGEVCNLCNQLKEIDVTITGEDVIIVLTAGLPESYNPVVISFDSIDPK